MKKAYIISHSHWDREWYLPYEKHHMLLIDFLDELIETLETDPNYKSFHLDGQTLLLFDYLQVRPEMKERLTKLIQEKRIHIGPWFILQDEFLTSSEANIRNLQIGHRTAREFGDVCKVGYFPDSFGNMGQAPQILNRAGIDTVVFGRGVKPTGFNNQVSDNAEYESPFSEMYWEAPDGTKVLGILFANWYSNGNEVPVDETAARKYWEEKLESAGKYASTDHLLFMNGCDHQPAQTDLSIAIETAKKVYPDVEFIHANFEQYISELRKDLPEKLQVVKGELRSQQTEGWYTLANTASSRIYTKQMNTRCQMLLEKVAEPLAAMAAQNGMTYPHHKFDYAWKVLMENHPHDSICGCSVDEVHREMVARFEKVLATVDHIIEKTLDFLREKFDTSKFASEAVPFVVANTSGDERVGVVEVVVDVNRMYFREAPLHEVIKTTKERVLPTYQVIDETGTKIDAIVEELPYEFGYDLPTDKFRQPYMANRVKVTMQVDAMKAMSFKAFALVEAKDLVATSEIVQSNIVETECFKAEFNEDGSFDLLDKKTNKTWENLGMFEDTGDIGNEYIFFAPVGVAPITTKGKKAEIKMVEQNSMRTVVEVTHTMEVPKKADEVLDQEIQDIVEFRQRKAKRSHEMISQVITAVYTFENKFNGVRAKVSFNNEALDHRVRALFPTNLATDVHYADSIFEVAKRDTTPSAAWRNPCNAQHQQAFVNVHDESFGLTIANKGLNEYEVLKEENTMAITIHRGTRELGDWGMFLTPEAQCLGLCEVEFAIFPHGDGSDVFRSYKSAYQYQIDWVTTYAPVQVGSIAMEESYVFSTPNEVALSAYKIAKENGDVVARFYNLSDDVAKVNALAGTEFTEMDILEETKLGTAVEELAVDKRAIITVAIK